MGARRAAQSHFVAAGIQPDPCPELGIELGPHGTGVGRWVAERKHLLLAKYLHGTRAAWASPKWKNRVFLDPFCSYGRMRAKDETFTRDGGAVVAWRESLAGGFPFTHVMVGDLEGAKAQACGQRLRALGAPAKHFVGEARHTLPQMLAESPGRATLFLAYLDPYNLRWLTFDLFDALASHRADIAAHFSLMDLKRNVDHELDPERARFDEAAPGWRAEPWASSTSKQNLQISYFGYWHAKVQSLGFKTSKEHPLVHNEDGSPLYRLVFFAKNELPLRIWDDVAEGPQRDFGF